MGANPRRWNWSARALAVVGVLVAMVVGGYAIAGASTPSSSSSAPPAHRGGGHGGGLFGVAGTVTAIGTTPPSVTVQPSDGSKSVTFDTKSSTRYIEACAQVTSKALAVGDQVVISPALYAMPATAALGTVRAPALAASAPAGLGLGSGGPSCFLLTGPGPSGGGGTTTGGGWVAYAGASPAAHARTHAFGSGRTWSFGARGNHGPGCPVPVSGISSVSGPSAGWMCCNPVPVSGVSSVSGPAPQGCVTPPAGPPVAGTIEIVLPVLYGTVVSTTTTSAGNLQFVLQDGQGFWRTVNTTPQTTYSSGGTTVSSSAVVATAEVVAFGTVDADHTSLDATSVFVLGPTESGSVRHVGHSDLTLRTSAGKSVTVFVGRHTSVRLDGKRATIAKVRTGTTVTVLGRRVKGGFQASEIRS